MRISKRGMALAALAPLVSLTVALPAGAQFSWTFWQTPVGPVDTGLNELEKELISQYMKGNLNPLQLAHLRHDVDGIRDRAEMARITEGMSSWKQKRILKRLNLVIGLVNDHLGERTRTVVQKVSILEPTQ